MDIDLDKIKSLLDMVGDRDITELSIEAGEEKITIKKQKTLVASTVEIPMQASRFQQAVASNEAAPAQPGTQGTAPKAAEDENNGKGLVSITSPMVGTFYRASSPSTPSFVSIGDVISPGQTVCIIEAMKLMNDLPAEISGRIVKVCVENGSTVEYGQPLFMVNPKV